VQPIIPRVRPLESRRIWSISSSIPAREARPHVASPRQIWGGGHDATRRRAPARAPSASWEVALIRSSLAVHECHHRYSVAALPPVRPDGDNPEPSCSALPLGSFTTSRFWRGWPNAGRPRWCAAVERHVIGRGWRGNHRDFPPAVAASTHEVSCHRREQRQQRVRCATPWAACRIDFHAGRFRLAVHRSSPVRATSVTARVVRNGRE
jgi:hypothetical protein